ncbi:MULTISPECIES: zinc-binding dehydrogenase [unclassified Pseudofrankia]|uniref:zinc-dependent alcohol dehydrogenase family protein n=1 Tax=unclassified Pseudofrankia TaxID=2994372 RepID=UPI0008D95095|nr:MULTISPECIES: zinc-binding dehydrogenase [unclassified Pseudofrankia]MDT3444663.1 zinc-binding dehydrogenase [Pseudofrankia sp. BMG5.37]OHV66594.1 iditol 2-dehydrogenase [Pseudofrankia sp. BMG5.36]
MRGVVFEGERTIDVATFDDPVARPGEVVVEIKASGMCGSDLKSYRLGSKAALASYGLGPDALDEGARIIAGHEPCGVVAAVGPGVDCLSTRVGDRVMVFHYTGCGMCRECRTGWTQLCERETGLIGTTVHGGHADFLKVPASTLVPLPDELTFSAGAAISCGTGTAFGGLVRMGLSARDTVAVFGLGPVGLAGVQLASAMGAEVIGVDIAADRVAVAQDFGAAHVIDSSTVDPVAAIRDLTRGRGVTCALEASGAASARQASVNGAATWGRVAFVGHGPSETPLDISRQVIRKQLTLIGSYTFSIVGQADCARFVVDHGVDVDQVFSNRWTIDQAAEAYVDFDKQTGGKALIEF